jgi:hypothetical protein
LSSIDIIKREKKKNKSLQVELKRKEETQNSKSEELERMISNITKTTLKVMHKIVLQEGLVKHIEEATPSLNH